MTHKKLKFHEDFVGQLSRLCHSEDFWRGLFNGMAPQRYLTSRCNYKRLLADQDSLYEIWDEVGELLTEAVIEFGHVQAGETSEADRKRVRGEAAGQLIRIN